MSFTYTNNFARILAKENIIIRRSIKATTTSFNMKTRVLIIPHWEYISEKLHDMLLVHEVGHALDTPLDPLVRAIKQLTEKYSSGNVKDYINVVEDARIDRRQKARYPGTIVDYALGYKELHSRDFFGINKFKDLSILPFIDRINLFFKNGHHLNLKFSPSEQVIVDRIATTETFDDVIDVVETILKYHYSKSSVIDALNALFSEDRGSEGSSEAEEGDAEEGSSGSGASSEGSSDEDEDNSEEGSSGSGASSDEDNTEEGSKGAGSSLEDDFEKLKSELDKSKDNTDKKPYVPEAQTAKNLDKALEKSKTKSNYEPSIVNVGLSDPKSVVVPFKKLLKNVAIADSFTKWRDEEKSNVSYMASEFERKKAADISKRVRVDKTGVLDMSTVYQYKYSDDVFKRQDIIPEGKNHGLIFLLDWSGSMTHIIHETLKQLLTLTMFCRMTNIPFDVYIFQSTSSRYLDRYSRKDFLLDDTAVEMTFSGFSLKNILSSKMTANEYLRMSSYLFDLTQKRSMSSGEWNMGGTPLLGSLEVLPEIVNSFISYHKVQVPTVFILTDGDSDGPSLGIGSSTYGIVFNNVKTKKSYSSTGHVRDMVGAMVENLRDATGSRVIGIHLLGGTTECQTRYKVSLNIEKGFSLTKERGYDKHYAIRATSMSMLTRDSFWKRFDRTVSGDDLSKAFTEYGKKKNSTRFLLRSFIDDISLDRTK